MYLYVTDKLCVRVMDVIKHIRSRRNISFARARNVAIVKLSIDERISAACYIKYWNTIFFSTLGLARGRKGSVFITKSDYSIRPLVRYVNL